MAEKIFNYTGAIQSWSAPLKGSYLAEAWGAQGGGSQFNYQIPASGATSGKWLNASSKTITDSFDVSGPHGVKISVNIKGVASWTSKSYSNGKCTSTLTLKCYAYVSDANNKGYIDEASSAVFKSYSQSGFDWTSVTSLPKTVKPLPISTSSSSGIFITFTKKYSNYNNTSSTVSVPAIYFSCDPITLKFKDGTVTKTRSFTIKSFSINRPYYRVPTPGSAAQDVTETLEGADGGYAKGFLDLNKNATLYALVGQQGKTGTSANQQTFGEGGKGSYNNVNWTATSGIYNKDVIKAGSYAGSGGGYSALLKVNNTISNLGFKEITAYSYTKNEEFSPISNLSTNFYIEWGKEFSIEETFTLKDGLGKRYLIIGNWKYSGAQKSGVNTPLFSGSQGTRVLNIEVQSNNKFRILFIPLSTNTSAGGEKRDNYDFFVGLGSSTPESVVANKEYTVRFTWTPLVNGGTTGKFKFEIKKPGSTEFEEASYWRRKSGKAGTSGTIEDKVNSNLEMTGVAEDPLVIGAQDWRNENNSDLYDKKPFSSIQVRKLTIKQKVGNTDNLYIVAGGGSGAGLVNAAGAGGGEDGIDGQSGVLVGDIDLYAGTGGSSSAGGFSFGTTNPLTAGYFGAGGNSDWSSGKKLGNTSGGGGGYYGGGAGTARSLVEDSGSGGGGSGFISASLRNGSQQNDVRSGNGQIKISWYVITLNTDGSTEQLAVAPGDSMTLPNRTKDNYNFIGWYTSATGGTKIGGAGDTYTPTGDGTIYARFEGVSHILTAKANGGSISQTTGWTGTGDTATKSIAYNSAYGTLPNVARTGYNLRGWFTAVSGGTQVTYSTKMGATNTTIYAQWAGQTSSVTLNKNGGTGGTSSVTATFGSAMPNITPPSRNGYTFSGYFDSNNIQYYKSDGTSYRVWDKTGAQTLYAKWTIITYTATFAPNGGNWQKEKETNYNIEDILKAPTTISRTGFTFIGWKVTAKEGNWELNKTYNNTSDQTILAGVKGYYGKVTFTAQWSAHKYTIKFNGNNSTSGSMANQIFNYDESKALTANAFKRTGYKFNGWSGSDGKSYTDKQVVSKLTAVNNGVITLTAKWEPIKYNIAFNANGGTGQMSSITNVKYDETIILPANTFIYNGRKFINWNTKADGSGKTYNDKQAVNNLTTVDGATVTLYAQWQSVSFIKINDTQWKSIKELYVKTETGWKKSKEIYVKTESGWKKFTGWA